MYVFDISNPAAPTSLGKFVSVASDSAAFRVTHDTELDDKGILWSLGGGGATGYRLTADPLAPELVASTGATAINPSPYNDFILHNSQRRGSTLLVNAGGLRRQGQTPPGGCRGQGMFDTWKIGMGVGDAYLGVDVLQIDRKADPIDVPLVTAPIPEVWLGGTTSTYGPSEIWGFACLTTNVTVA